MRFKLYNNKEKKYSKLLDDLKELPKINAPENFEYNLMTKISNKNFGEIKERKESFNIIKFFAPSAVVVTVIVLFFIFLPNGEQTQDNPLMSDPPQIVFQQEQYNGSIRNGTVKNKSMEGNSTLQSKNSSLAERKVSVNPNDAVIKPSTKYPINRNRSIALDDYISGKAVKRNNLQQGNVVKSGEEEVEFDGFLLREEPDPKTLEKYRSMLDSVKKAEAKADSLKKVKKHE